MARHSAGVRTATAGSTTLPIASLYGIANVGGQLREVGCFNSTVTAVNVKLIRLTSAGTQGAGLVEADHIPGSPARMTAHNSHTGAPGLGDDLGYRVPLAPSIGSGIIWTFGDSGILIPAGTASGIGIIIAIGTGQICDVWFVWDE